MQDDEDPPAATNSVHSYERPSAPCMRHSMTFGIRPISKCIHRSSLHHVWQYYRSQSTAIASNTTISPALLDRARGLAVEHHELTKRLNNEYDTYLAKKAGSLSAVTSALRDWEIANNVRCQTLVFLGRTDTRAVSARTTTAHSRFFLGRRVAVTGGSRVGDDYSKARKALSRSAEKFGPCPSFRGTPMSH